MSKYYTILWNHQGWKDKIKESEAGNPDLTYAASNNLKPGKVSIGDTLFIVNIKDGELRLGGIIRIVALGDGPTAATYLGVNMSDLWKSDFYAMADEQDRCRFRPHLVIPNSVVGSLLFTGPNGYRSPVITKDGAVSPQTLRSLRELVPGEEKKLLELLA